jgi:hypothetical protein
MVQRKEMMRQCVEEKRGNLSFHLGGKAASDGQKWTPNMEAVRHNAFRDRHRSPGTEMTTTLLLPYRP